MADVKVNVKERKPLSLIVLLIIVAAITVGIVLFINIGQKSANDAVLNNTKAEAQSVYMAAERIVAEQQASGFTVEDGVYRTNTAGESVFVKSVYDELGKKKFGADFEITIQGGKVLNVMFADAKNNVVYYPE